MRIFLYLLAIVCIGILCIVAGGAWGIKYYNAPGPNTEEITVIIPKNTGFQEITHILHESGIIEHPVVFGVTAVLQDKARLIKAGEYAFPAYTSPKDVLISLVEGKTVIHRLTVPEGWMASQITALIEKENKLSGELPLDIGEGELFPDTYYFSRGDSRAELVARMKRDMRSTLMMLWEKRQADLPFRTPQEALILASIVEKETGVESEYKTVASVYINRLRQNMLLQADPTVIYGITLGKEVLQRALKISDLRVDSPYNTYTRAGLPPGPIASPSRKALEAVLDPAQTNYIFFVANGIGGHNFSSTLESHNKYVTQFRNLLKSQREKKVIPVKAADSAPKTKNAMAVPESDTIESEAAELAPVKKLPTEKFILPESTIEILNDDFAIQQ